MTLSKPSVRLLLPIRIQELSLIATSLTLTDRNLSQKSIIDSQINSRRLCDFENEIFIVSHINLRIRNMEVETQTQVADMHA